MTLVRVGECVLAWIKCLRRVVVAELEERIKCWMLGLRGECGECGECGEWVSCRRWKGV